jgi:Uma2 family endonuclease
VVSGNLFGLLWMHLRQQPSGAVFHAPFDVVFSRFDVVEPDLLFVSQTRLEILTSANVQGSPDLVVEILSPGTRRIDETTKRKLYETFGVQEYWVVDPELDTIKVYRRSQDAFEKVCELSAERNDVLTTPLVPGWSARLSDIFTSPA